MTFPDKSNCFMYICLCHRSNDFFVDHYDLVFIQELFICNSINFYIINNDVDPSILILGLSECDTKSLTSRPLNFDKYKFSSVLLSSGKDSFNFWSTISKGRQCMRIVLLSIQFS
jgi:hypothetical protein